MERLNKYPRGYYTRLVGVMNTTDAEVEIVDVPYDEELENLYKMFMGRVISSDSWAFKARVIQRCAKLFGNFRSWLVMQVAENDNIYELNLDFLQDTVQFIRTGRRSMSVFNWHELLLEYPHPKPGVACGDRLVDLRLLDDKEFDNFIGLWCSKKGGFEDMLCTAHVLFGAAKKPYEALRLKV